MVDESYSESDDCSDVAWVNCTTFVDEANKAKDIKCKMLIDGKSITFQIDTYKFCAKIKQNAICVEQQYSKAFRCMS